MYNFYHLRNICILQSNHLRKAKALFYSQSDKSLKNQLFCKPQTPPFSVLELGGVLIDKLFFFKFNDIVYVTVKRIAKRIQGFGADSFTFFNTVKCVCRKALFEYQVVFGYPFFEKGIVKRFVTNQQYHR